MFIAVIQINTLAGQTRERGISDLPWKTDEEQGEQNTLRSAPYSLACFGIPITLQATSDSAPAASKVALRFETAFRTEQGNNVGFT